ncbi:hypothetical protein BDW59DRAFT_157914 [Aspergillus cavernicola]|uniref:Uncharacterized protein n=1 Tax=Aspergillus cavernicola TaxID=176166 RepID=A0ABR4IUP0_9EURO
MLNNLLLLQASLWASFSTDILGINILSETDPRASAYNQQFAADHYSQGNLHHGRLQSRTISILNYTSFTHGRMLRWTWYTSLKTMDAGAGVQRSSMAWGTDKPNLDNRARREPVRGRG